MDAYELGYTPKNLKKIRSENKLTQQEVADITGTAMWRTVSKWEKDLGESTHMDMPYTKWVALLSFLHKKS